MAQNAQIRMGNAFDEIRIRQLIDMMCCDFGASRQEVIDDLKELIEYPTSIKVDIFSEIWMTYS